MFKQFNLAEYPTVKNGYFNLFYKGFLQWVWGSLALEKVLLFSVPSHPMLICGNKYVSRITETLGIKNIFQLHSACLLCMHVQYNNMSKSLMFTSLFCLILIYCYNIELNSFCNSVSRLLVGTVPINMVCI